MTLASKTPHAYKSLEPVKITIFINTSNNSRWEGMKILVVHRQKKSVAVIKSVLSEGQTVVLNTESGLDGLLTSRIEHFDLIICGTDLPVVTGFELVRSIRTNSVNRHTPVILVCDELTDKVKYLGSALDVKDFMLESQIKTVLPAIMKSLASVKTPVRSVSAVQPITSPSL